MHVAAANPRFLLPRASAVIALLSALTLAAPAFAFDGRRAGFVMGVGLGGGGVSVKIDPQAPGASYGLPRSEERLTEALPATDFELGKGSKDGRLCVYYANQVFWMSEGNRVGLTGVGVRVFRRPEAPAWFAEGGAGLSGWSGNLGDTLGWGVSAGGGLEFAAHWMARARGMVGGAMAPQREGMASGWGASLGVQYVAY